MGELRKKRIVRWCALLCIICIVFALFGVVNKAYAAGSASISGSSVSAEKGDTVTVSFYLSNNPGVWGAKGEISYDASVLTLKSVDAGGIFSASEIIMGENLSQNPFVFVATGSTIADKTNNGTLIKATFAVSSNAELGDYFVGIRISQFINVNSEDVSVSASGAKIAVVSCLHRETVLKNVVQATEEAEGYSGDAYCKRCDILVKKGTTTPKYVNTCEHKNQERIVVTEATCEKAGLAKISCPDCNKELSEEEIPATGHIEAGLTGWKAATTTEEGYTGDIRCQTCDKIIEEGVVIPKIEILVFDMTMQTEDTYRRGSLTGLVFVSEAELDTFVRLEIDGMIPDAKNYILNAGSTKITLKPEYLETLADGKHTATIVSDAGTASAQFYVAAAQEEVPETPQGIPYRTLLIITIIAVIITVICVVLTVLTVIGNKKRGRYDNYEKH